MSPRRAAPPLADISDEDFRARLRPLERAVLPGSRAPDPPPPPGRREGDDRKRGVEVLLPERVIDALKRQALERRTSMSCRVLEILRDAGLPVEAGDFVDLRRQKRG